jgi:hypothetical protein
MDDMIAVGDAMIAERAAGPRRAGADQAQAEIVGPSGAYPKRSSWVARFLSGGRQGPARRGNGDRCSPPGAPDLAAIRADLAVPHPLELSR